MITASGEILEASNTSNSDLFNGIRGAGCNFGVVSEFVFQLHPQRSTVYAGHMIFPRTPEMLQKLKPLILAFWKTIGLDDGALVVVASSPQGGAVSERAACLVVAYILLSV